MPASGAARVGRSASGGRSNRAARGESWLSGSAQRARRSARRRTFLPGTRTSRPRSTTRSRRSSTSWSASLSTPYAAAQTADLAARKAMEHGVRQVEVFVKGPGAGREQAIRSRSCRGPGGHRDHGRNSHSPQRLPPTEAATGLAMSRYTDPVCRICRREGLKLFLKGSRCYSKKCCSSAAARRPE